MSRRDDIKGEVQKGAITELMESLKSPVNTKAPAANEKQTVFEKSNALLKNFAKVRLQKKETEIEIAQSKTQLDTNSMNTSQDVDTSVERDLTMKKQLYILKYY